MVPDPVTNAPELCSRRRDERSPAVVGKFQGIDNIPSERKSCHSGDCARLDYCIPHKQSPSRPWREGGCKAGGTLLLRLDESPQNSFVVVKGFLMSSAHLAQFACQDISGSHCKGRALARHQGYAECRIAH